MNTQIAVIENPQQIVAFDANKIDDLLAAVRKEALSLVADVSTRKGRDELKSQAYKVSQTKTHLVKLANASIEEHREIVKAVTSERVRLEKELDAIRDEVKAPAVEWEAKEEARKQEHRDYIAYIKSFTHRVESFTSDQIQDSINAVKGGDLRDCEEFNPMRDEEIQNTLNHLESALAARKQYEAEQAELKRLREAEEKRLAEEAARKAEEERKAAELKAAQEAKERAEREAKEAAEREERRKAEEAQRIKEAEERAKREERERIEREHAAKKAAEEVEAKRKADEERKQREIAEAKAANEKHRANVRSKAALAIAEEVGITQDVAAQIVLRIEGGQIPSVSIKF